MIVAAPGGDVQETRKMFINNLAGVDSRDRDRAEKLRTALASKSRLAPRRPDIKKWSYEFRQMREGKVPNISPVLNWYCQNIGKPGVPDVRSAGTFRRRFRDLEKAMQNTEGDTGGVRIYKSTRRYVNEHLLDLNWPGDSEKRLPAAVQASANNHAIMISRLETIVADADGLEREWPATVVLAFDILADHQETHTFVHTWFLWVYGKVRGWDNWNGSFRQFIFRPDHKRFSAQMHNKSIYATGDCYAWANLLKEIV